jgi:hypothetical protein
MTWIVWLALALVALFIIGMPLLIWSSRRKQDAPAPTIDRSRAYPAKVIGVYNTSGFETAEPNVKVEFVDASGETQRSYLADVIDDHSIGVFALGSTCQIYPYSPESTRVVLTQAHDDIWRRGYNLDGVHIGGMSGPVDRGPGSPFPARPRGYGA